LWIAFLGIGIGAFIWLTLPSSLFCACHFEAGSQGRRVSMNESVDFAI
jgi:hypothetical protein